MAKFGLLVNPIAGMGGAVGLKGTDGAKTLREARKRGARPVSPEKTREFLQRLNPSEFTHELIVAPGPMGEELAKAEGLQCKSIGTIERKTTAIDMVRISGLMKRRRVDLLLFCGGDGTARDILRGVGSNQPVLGVPAGVKVYSSVFAITPSAAAETTLRFLSGTLPTRRGEVLDIDEKMYRRNLLSVKLVGYLTTPDSGFLIQGSKSATRDTETEELISVAKYVREEMNPETVYVLGPGTTVEKIGEGLGMKKTLLGVDLVKGDGTILERDVDEAQLLRQVGKGPLKIIVSPIGGQGFLFGRGNQQISSRVIWKAGVENLIVVASRTKIELLEPRRLLVDTGDPELDKRLKGYVRVVTGYREEMVLKVE